MSAPHKVVDEKQVAVRHRVRMPGANGALFGTGLCTVAAVYCWPQGNTGILSLTAYYLSLSAAAAFAVRAMILLVRDYRLRSNLAAIQDVSLDFGSAGEADADDRRTREMHRWESGGLLGLTDDDVTVFRPADTPFGLFEMPPGVGKTTSYVIGSILHRAMQGYSLVIADPKLELAPMLAPSLRKLGFEVWCANPAKRYLELCGDVELSPYQAMIDAVYSDGRHRADAVKYAGDYADLHYPAQREDLNPYFSLGSRRAMMTAKLSLALYDPAGCTPTGVYQLLTDPASFSRILSRNVASLEGVTDNDALVDFLRAESKNLLHRARKNEENFGAFLEGASQRLLSFNPAGRLAHYGRNAVCNIADLRERQIILFLMTPLSHQREFADFTSIANHNILAACKARPSGHKVHIVAEEALNYRFSNLVSDLETMRGLGVTADFFIQSFAGLEKRYGREAAQAIESYADVRVYAGLNSLARAKHVSDMLSDRTIRHQDFSYGAEAKELSISSREQSRPLMKPDELMRMPKGRAWVFVRGLAPMNLRMVHYGQVDPWRDWAAASPINGQRLYEKPLVHIDYGEAANG